MQFRPTLSCPTQSYPMQFRPTLSCPTQSYPLQFRPTQFLFLSVLSYVVLGSPVLLCPVPPCLVLRCPAPVHSFADQLVLLFRPNTVWNIHIPYSATSSTLEPPLIQPSLRVPLIQSLVRARSGSGHNE